MIEAVSQRLIPLEKGLFDSLGMTAIVPLLSEFFAGHVIIGCSQLFPVTDSYYFAEMQVMFVVIPQLSNG